MSSQRDKDCAAKAREDADWAQARKCLKVDLNNLKDIQKQKKLRYIQQKANEVASDTYTSAKNLQSSLLQAALKQSKTRPVSTAAEKIADNGRTVLAPVINGVQDVAQTSSVPCDHCRRTKKACDKNIPTCGKCLRTKHVCVYSSRKRTRGKCSDLYDSNNKRVKRSGMP